jgi:hypothetical protein
VSACLRVRARVHDCFGVCMCVCMCVSVCWCPLCFVGVSDGASSTCCSVSCGGPALLATLHCLMHRDTRALPRGTPHRFTHTLTSLSRAVSHCMCVWASLLCQRRRPLRRCRRRHYCRLRSDPRRSLHLLQLFAEMSLTPSLLLLQLLKRRAQAQAGRVWRVEKQRQRRQ